MTAPDPMRGSTVLVTGGTGGIGLAPAVLDQIVRLQEGQ